MLFSWKRRRTDTALSPPRTNPLPPSKLDWSAFENAEGWPSIKVWLTDEITQSLDQLAQYRDQSRSEVMRDLLFISMYGHFTYAQMLAERRGLLREPGRLESGERVHLSLQRNPESALDKKREPDRRDPKKRVNVRLFVPVPLKERLESIAERRRETLSQCTRNLLQHALLGVMF